MNVPVQGKSPSKGASSSDPLQSPQEIGNMVKKLVHIVTLIVVAAGLSSGQDSHPTREGQPPNVG